MSVNSEVGRDVVQTNRTLVQPNCIGPLNSTGLLYHDRRKTLFQL